VRTCQSLDVSTERRANVGEEVTQKSALKLVTNWSSHAEECFTHRPICDPQEHNRVRQTHLQNSLLLAALITTRQSGKRAITKETHTPLPRETGRRVGWGRGTNHTQSTIIQNRYEPHRLPE
jgi:hypothetical protein